jgi:hypothetical protein|tara:strand:+ start:181 stop:576 length:396 start_codon:yes stop_codon:yes gene_type:complete
MIQQITSKIMLGGICKYANIYQDEEKNVQIRVSKNGEDSLNYEMCQNWQPKESVTFKDILNKKIDILGYEQLSTPFLLKSLNLYQKEFEAENETLSIFLFNRNDKVGLAVFEDKKNLKLLTLSKHFEQLGL